VPFCASTFVAAVFFQPIGAPSALPYEVTFPVRKAALKPGMVKEAAEATLGTKGQPCSGFETVMGPIANPHGWAVWRYEVGRGQTLAVEYELDRWRWVLKSADLQADRPTGGPKGVPRGGSAP
jgi:hypothetical protein